MSNKHMDPEAVISLANDVRKQGDLVKEQINTLVSIVASVREAWDDRAMDEFQNQFNVMNKNVFTKFDELVSSCSQYMINEANRRLETEELGVQEARKLSEFV